MNYKVAVIPGDGIGPEIVREARKVLDKVGQKYGHEFTYQELLMGGCSRRHWKLRKQAIPCC